jgi:hypothetical protein
LFRRAHAGPGTDVMQFHELLYASGARPERELIADLDGCTGAKAGEIVAMPVIGFLETGSAAPVGHLVASTAAR